VALRGVIARVVAAVLAMVWLVVSGFSASLPSVDSQSGTTDGAPITSNSTQVTNELLAMHVTAVIGDYWLMRPIQYQSGGRIFVAISSGPIGFPDDQHAALSSGSAAWLFVPGEAAENTFVQVAEEKSVTWTLMMIDGLHLYTNLSSPVLPSDLAPS
jgi:hypothetical protein